jgi:uncharacterized protein (TIGR03435 family)
MRRTVLACLLIAACCAAYGQNTPEFDVASVKQLDPSQSVQPGRPDLSFVGKSGKPFQIEGHRVTVQGTARTLIADAYDVRDYQVAAAPGWADTLMYAITAEVSGDSIPTQDQVRPMLKSLLADRFQLKLHTDTKELPVYHLTRPKKSNLLKEAEPGESFSWNLTQTPGGTLRSKATKESIGDFVQLVGVSTDRPVIDKTGLTGDIDYDILISPPEFRTPQDLNREIVYAVIDQLGLKLEPAKDSIGILVVDQISKPSEN